VIASFGVGLILMGVVGTTSVAFLILFTLGIGNGVLAITLITFLQRQSPKEMLGRVMSLVMLAGVGLVPVSQALTGMLIKMNLTGLFAVTGILMLLIAMWLAVQPVMRTIGQVLEAEVETAQV
jgi:MFS family permease